MYFVSFEEVKTRRFRLNNSFIVEATETKDTYGTIIQYYLYHSNYGIKTLMVEIYKDDFENEIVDEYGFVLHLVEVYMDSYIEDFMDEEPW